MKFVIDREGVFPFGSWLPREKLVQGPQKKHVRIDEHHVLEARVLCCFKPLAADSGPLLAFGYDTRLGKLCHSTKENSIGQTGSQKGQELRSDPSQEVDVVENDLHTSTL